MKAFNISLFSLLFSVVCFSQTTMFNNQDSAIISNANTTNYDLKVVEKSGLATRLPFEKITFYDVRYDTSFVAINWQVNSATKVGKVFKKKLNLTYGLAAGLTGYVNNFYKSNFSFNNKQLVCFIKKFSIILKNSLANNKYLDEHSSSINVELECYYKSDSALFPAIRFDTTYDETNSRLSRTFPQLVKEMIDPFIAKMSSMDSSSVAKRHLYTQDQIQNRYQQRFNIPILTNDHLVKGVYKTFSEFRNNAPSITNFKVQNIHRLYYDTRFDLLHDSADNIINTLEIFGFCDGTTCWIQHEDHCFPLVRVDNSFEFLYYLFPNSNGTNMPPSLIDRISPFKFLLALNMENGKIE